MATIVKSVSVGTPSKRVTGGWDINNLVGVDTTGKKHADILVYDSNTAKYVTAEVSTGGGLSFLWNDSGQIFQLTIDSVGFDADVRALISVTDAGGDGSLAYNSATGVITYTGPSASEVRSHFSVANASGDGLLAYDSSTGRFTYTGPSAAETRAHFSAGTNLSYNSSTGVYSLDSTQDVKVQTVTTSGDIYSSGNIEISGLGNAVVTPELEVSAIYSDSNTISIGSDVNVNGKITADSGTFGDLRTSAYRFPLNDAPLSGQAIISDGAGNLSFAFAGSEDGVVVAQLRDLTDVDNNLNLKKNPNTYLRWDSSFTENDSTGQFTSRDFVADVRSSLSAAGDLTYNSTTGEFSFDVESVYTKANFDSDLDEAINGGTGLSYDSGTNRINIDSTGVTSGTYGSASLVPVITVNPQGQIDSIGTVSVAGVSSVSFDSASYKYTINTADGGTYEQMIHTRIPGTAGTYGSASQVPVIIVNEYGLVDSVTTVSVAGVSSTTYDSATGVFTINTADGGSFKTTIHDSDDRISEIRNAVSASGDLSYDANTGVFSFDVEQVYTKANFDSDFDLRISETDLVDSTDVSNIIIADVDKTFVDALNINADQLDGQEGTYYLDYNNFTNKPDLVDSTDVANIIANTDFVDSTDVANIIAATDFVDSTDVANIIAATDFVDSTDVSNIITADVDKTFVDALNINADQLDGQEGTYYLDYNNFTNKPFILDSNNVDTIIAGTDLLDSTDARNLLSGGTGVTYTAGTGEIAIGQSVGTTDDVTFGKITSDSNSVGQVEFRTNWVDSHIGFNEGFMWYDPYHKNLNYYTDVDHPIEIGLQVVERVYNNTGSTILKGKPLYYSGNRTNEAGQESPTVALANATESTKYNVQGLAGEDIPDNSYGLIVVAGVIDGFDTSGLTAGQNFFAGLTDGAVQNAPPEYPNYPMCLGWVIKSDATDGKVIINQQNHSVNSFRVQGNTHISADLRIDGNLVVAGTQTITSTENVNIGGNIQYLNAGNTIGEAGTTFVGSGLDDAFFTGHYNGDSSTKSFYVKIDSAGPTDTFEWGHDSTVGAVQTGILITGNEQTLDSEYGISIDFGATTGHTLNDKWVGTAVALNTDTGIFSNKNEGDAGNGYTHVGVYWDASEDEWTFVGQLDSEPEAPIDRSSPTFQYGDVRGKVFYGTTFTGALSGNATTATALANPRDFSLTGDITASAVSFDGSGNVQLTTAYNPGSIVNDDINASAAIVDTKLATISTAGKVSNSATTATNANTASAIVARDSSGNFSAGTITATLSGNASSADSATNAGTAVYAGYADSATNAAYAVQSGYTTGNAATATALETARDIAGVSFDGTSNISLALTNLGISDGSPNQVLTTNGSGTFTFEDLPPGTDSAAVQAIIGATPLTGLSGISDGTSNQFLKTDGAGNFSFDSVATNATANRFTYTVSTATDSINGADDIGRILTYNAPYVDVYLNGVKMRNGTNVFVTTGTNIVFDSAIGTGTTDYVDVIAYETFNVNTTTLTDLSGIVDGTNKQTLTTDGNGNFFFDSAIPNATSRRFSYTVSTSTDSLNGPDIYGRILTYDSDKVDVYLNGVRLRNGVDVITNTGTNLVFDSAIGTGVTPDLIDVVAYNVFQLNTATLTDLDGVVDGTKGQWFKTNGDGTFYFDSSPNVTSRRFQYTVSASADSLNGADDNGRILTYDSNFVDVYLNGIKMRNGLDVTVNTGTSIIFDSAIGTTATPDYVDVIAYHVSTVTGTGLLDLNGIVDGLNGQVLKTNGAGVFTFDSALPLNATSARYQYNVSTTTDSVSGTDANGNTLLYDSNFVDVYLNGVKLRNGTDVFVNYGNKIVFDSNIGTAGTDELDIIAYNTFEIANITAANITSGTLGFARGGTGLSSLGTAGQAIVVNGAGTALEFGDVSPTNLTSSAFASAVTLNIKNSAGTNLKTIVGSAT